MEIRFSALLEEVYGINVVAYHRTESKDIISGILEKGFIPGEGMLYGQGFYATYDLDSQLKSGMKRYGNIILKTFIKAYKFLIFDYDIAKKVYKDKYTLIDQLENMNLLKYVRDIKTIEEYSKELETIEYSSDIVLKVYSYEKSIISSINGIIFTGKTDGKVIVVYEPNAIVPMAFSEDDGKSWIKISNKQSLQRYFINKQDVLTKQNKFQYTYKELTDLVNSNKIPLDNAMNYLINTKDGEYIYNAGRYWKHFDFKKGLDALIDLKDSERIYYAHLNWKEFDFKKGLDALIELKDGYYIYRSGVYWKQFDYKKALDALIDLNSVESIVGAGQYWKQFDYDKALNAILNIDKLENNKYIYNIYDAMRNWKNINYDKALNYLLNNIHTSEDVIYFEKQLLQNNLPFDYKKGLEVLKRLDTRYYEFALKSWKGKY
jgi:hypothetical protein